MDRKTDRSANGAVSAEKARIFIAKAHQKFHDEGTIEVDTEMDNPLDQVSTAETVVELIDNGGLYVKAWVWVSLDELSAEDRRKVLGKKS